MSARAHVVDGVFRPGDRVRLGDTNLVVRVEPGVDRPREDDGHALLAGFGKTARDGIGR